MRDCLLILCLSMILVGCNASSGDLDEVLDAITSGSILDADTSSDPSSAFNGINSREPAGSTVPELGEHATVQVRSESPTAATVTIQYWVGDFEAHHAQLTVPAGATMSNIGPDLATQIEIEGTYANGQNLPSATYVLGDDFAEGDVLVYVIVDPASLIDACPNDPSKSQPGVCGCGVADTDSDGDGTADCDDDCPNDLDKIEPGACGCGEADTDSNADGTPDCLTPPTPSTRPSSGDQCPDDPYKSTPGICGCGMSDYDFDGDSVMDCVDDCPYDSAKTDPGSCGCGVPDSDTDGDGMPDCSDLCPDDPAKIAPGSCGCGVPDLDDDQDGVMDCFDQCPGTYPRVWVNFYGCETLMIPDFDFDGDVDQEDFAYLQLCSGESVTRGDYCFRSDLTLDGMVNGNDVAIFSHCQTGADITVDPSCRDCNENGRDDMLDILDCCPDDPSCQDVNLNGYPDSCDY